MLSGGSITCAGRHHGKFFRNSCHEFGYCQVIQVLYDTIVRHDVQFTVRKYDGQKIIVFFTAGMVRIPPSSAGHGLPPRSVAVRRITMCDASKQGCQTVNFLATTYTVWVTSSSVVKSYSGSLLVIGDDSVNVRVALYV
jgi:hypothetical protein